MPRLFVAIPLPEDVKDTLVSAQPPDHNGLRLIGRDEMHVTLHFLGEIAAPSADAVRQALARVKVPAFAIGVNGTGAFPSAERPRVLWAGMESSSRFIALHRGIETALTGAIDYQPDARPFAPHITLARINAPIPRRVIDDFLQQGQGLQIPSVPVRKFILYSSAVVDRRPRYKEEAVFDLSID